jgi:AraC family transcriptional regulator
VAAICTLHRNIRGQIGQRTYGVICQTGDAGLFDYICGVEVSELESIPAGLAGLRIPERRYAVFSHRDHVSRIRGAFHTIFNKWLPNSGYELAAAPVFERYLETFDPHTGIGGIEIWVPVK